MHAVSRDRNLKCSPYIAYTAIHIHPTLLAIHAGSRDRNLTCSPCVAYTAIHKTYIQHVPSRMQCLEIGTSPAVRGTSKACQWSAGSPVGSTPLEQRFAHVLENPASQQESSQGFSAELSVRSPRKLFNIIIPEKKTWDQSIQEKKWWNLKKSFTAGVPKAAEFEAVAILWKWPSGNTFRRLPSANTSASALHV